MLDSKVKHEMDVEKNNEKISEMRAERYIMQSIAKKAIPTERVATCLRLRVKKRGNDCYGNIKIWQHQQTKRAFYTGLNVCGSPWTCPVYASKISERRKLELKQAFEAHSENGGYFGFLTLTFKHSREDKLNDILE